MENLIKEMQDPETGVPVRSQKLFLSVIPSAFMGKKFLFSIILFLFFKCKVYIILLNIVTKTNYIIKQLTLYK